MEKITEREYYETMLDSCKAILNAESEEEVQFVREDVAKELSERFGYDEIAVDMYMTRVEKWVELAETGEMTTDEMMQAINDRFSETETLTEAQSNAASTLATALASGGGIGLALGIFMGICKLKKKNLESKKSRGL